MTYEYPQTCEKDAYGNHYFERIGVDRNDMIFRCTQCKKAYREEIKYFNNEDLDKCG